VPSLPKAVRGVRLPYPALKTTTPRPEVGVLSFSGNPHHFSGFIGAVRITRNLSAFCFSHAFAASPNLAGSAGGVHPSFG
jgi:hypothetical protein